MVECHEAQVQLEADSEQNVGKETKGGLKMARRTQVNERDSDARMRPGSMGRPGGNIVDPGSVVNTSITWQRMAGNQSNAATRATGPIVDPNTKDKKYNPRNVR